MRLKDVTYILILFLVIACASIGNPDGGPYDEEPPVLLESEPAINATNVKKGKVVLSFNENVKLNNAFDKVVVSPPQSQMPEIKHNGRHVTVELYDTLAPNTTYSIDFGDAIVDNNEGNPYENFAYVFSTGDVVDTLAVSGTVLNAEDLEPIKGMVVGLHSVHADTAFTSKPFERVARTDSRGRFTIKGIAPGSYRIYALADANQNNFFDQKSEKIAFMKTTVSPFATEAVRPDTVWRDSLTIDTIHSVRYTRFQPDDIVLRAFNEEMKVQYLVKSPRDTHNKFVLYFASPNAELPHLKGISHNVDNAYIIEASEKMDTLTYWLKDSLLYRNDTIALSVTYSSFDDTGAPASRCDTISLVPKKKWEKIVEAEAKLYEEAKKKFLKIESRREGYDENNPPEYIPPAKVLPFRFTGGAAMDINADCRIMFDEPLLSADTAAIHLFVMADSLWTPMDFVFRQSAGNIRNYNIFAEWRPEQNYRIEIDSAAFKGIYGGTSGKFTRDMKFRSLNDYAVLYLRVPGIGDNAIVQLMTKDERTVMQERTKGGRCSFYFIKPGTYYLRLIVDENSNGKWDTGDFLKGVQPEKVYYYHHELDLRAMFEYSQDDWNINAPLNEQKPLEITRQKPDKERKKMNRNASRKFK